MWPLFQKERKPPSGACFFPNGLACLGVILLHIYYKEGFTYSIFTHVCFDSQRLALRSHISEHHFLKDMCSNSIKYGVPKMNIFTVSSGYLYGNIYMSFFATKNPNFSRDMLDLFGPFSSTWWDIDPPVRWCWRWHICMRVTSCHGAPEMSVAGPLLARHPWQKVKYHGIRGTRVVVGDQV